MLYSMEDEPRMIKLLFEEKKNEGREEARAEDMKLTIELLMDAGLSEEEATRMAEEEFNMPSYLNSKIKKWSIRN